LAGQCAKLKCCLNYEVDDYMEASRHLPAKDIVLQTQDADYYYFKADILAGLVSYSTDKNIAANLETITAERAREIINMNRNGEKPLALSDDSQQQAQRGPIDLLEGADLSRFDKTKRRKNRNNKQNKQRNKQPKG
jgi:cell fate regulator YaaT (PSP1 superfamily)